MPPLTDKEIIILDQISRNPSMSQRELARMTSISLGLINVILRRLLKKGYMEVSPLNKRKMAYLLTKEGLLQALKRNHLQITNIIKKYKSFQMNLANLLKKLHGSGYEYFSIYGDGELKELVGVTFQQCLEETPVTLGQEHRAHSRAVVLNVTSDPIDQGFKGDVVNIIEKIGVLGV